MARFNAKTDVKATRARTGGDTVNLAGGQAHSLSKKEELASILLTSFVNDQFYRSAGDTLKQVESLIKKGDPLFAAKAAVFARNEFGMRSISHVVAAEIAKQVKGANWTTDFFDSIVRRVDDMYEILGYYGAKYIKNNGRIRKNGKRKIFGALPNAMRRGFCRAFGRFDSYQLAKYRAGGKELSLVDLVRLLHVPVTERNAEALALLMKGDLKSTETWESMLTRAGQTAKNADDLSALKADAWNTLIKERKIGYFALLRNLRNISTQAPKLVKDATKMLTDKALIKKSLVLPFRFFTAYEELEGVVPREMLVAISEALNISCDNVPEFEGRTLIVLDDSGSMTSCRVSGNQKMSPATIGALMSAVMLRKNPNADFMMFNDSARYVDLPVDSGVISNMKWITGKFRSAGTDFHSIFKTAKKAYDRIVIFSDMQGWVGYHSPSMRGGSFDQYKKKFNCDPYVYSFDLQGYGTSQFNPIDGKTFMLAGFSDKVFDIMKLLETDKSALVNRIEEVTFTK
jgi:60 kDa SS-A/Ro ribonucleoprotein